MKLPKGFWKAHADAVFFVEANWQELDDFYIAQQLSIDLGHDIKPEQVRSLRRMRGWTRSLPKNGELFEKHVFMGDLEIPFHDEKMLALFYVFLKYFKPDKLWILGDFLAWYQVSKWTKDPRLINDLQENINTGNRVLDVLGSLVDKIEFLGGNHEFRMVTYLREHPAMHSLDNVQVASLLKLHERGIKHHPWKQAPVNYRSLQIHHGSFTRKHSGWTAKGHWEKYGGNGIIGHCHRMGNYIKRTTDGVWGWWENGCMRSLKPEYGGFFDWVQGWSLAYFSKKDLFHLEQIPVIKHKFLFQGRLFKV